MAFNHDTNPKMKNNSPMMKIETMVCRLVTALASIAVAIVLFIIQFYDYGLQFALASKLAGKELTL